MALLHGGEWREGPYPETNYKPEKREPHNDPFEVEITSDLGKEIQKVIGSNIPESKNWTEDYHLENGQYLNTCCHCKSTFIGYKRRVVCKECAK